MGAEVKFGRRKDASPAVTIAARAEGKAGPVRPFVAGAVVIFCAGALTVPDMVLVLGRRCAQEGLSLRRGHRAIVAPRGQREIEARLLRAAAQTGAGRGCAARSRARGTAPVRQEQMPAAPVPLANGHRDPPGGMHRA